MENSINTANVRELEAALLTRAKRLAGEYLSRAQHNRDRIIEEANERIHRREEQEVLAAKAMAERLYRRRVQASELKLQGDLERRRWELVQAVMEDLQRYLAVLVADETRYLPVLQRLLGAAAVAIEQEELIAELNQTDLKRLEKGWESFVAESGVDKRIILSSAPLDCSGGVRVMSKDQRIRVDNTFEGRQDRWAEALYQVAVERLFVQPAPIEGVRYGHSP